MYCALAFILIKRPKYIDSPVYQLFSFENSDKSHWSDGWLKATKIRKHEMNKKEKKCKTGDVTTKSTKSKPNHKLSHSYHFVCVLRSTQKINANTLAQTTNQPSKTPKFCEVVCVFWKKWDAVSLDGRKKVWKNYKIKKTKVSWNVRHSSEKNVYPK